MITFLRAALGFEKDVMVEGMFSVFVEEQHTRGIGETLGNSQLDGVSVPGWTLLTSMDLE